MKTSIMSNLHHSRTLAAGRVSMQPPECARPRAQQRPQADQRRNSPVLPPDWGLLRPGTGTLRLLAAALLLAGAGNAWAGVHYVDVKGTNATPPYTNWATAATHIQDAVDAAVAGDEIVVTNGVYTTFYGQNGSSVSVEKALNIRSVNGPQFTSIKGNHIAGRCAYLTNGASLSGFTLTQGYVQLNWGGGVYGGT